jgi:hypothetical protein
MKTENSIGTENSQKNFESHYEQIVHKKVNFVQGEGSMRQYYMNKVNKEIVIYTHTDRMDGEVYFKDLKEEVQMSCDYSYWKGTYVNLTRAVDKLEKVVANHGDYTTPNLPTFDSDDREKLLILVKALIK